MLESDHTGGTRYLPKYNDPVWITYSAYKPYNINAGFGSVSDSESQTSAATLFLNHLYISTILYVYNNYPTNMALWFLEAGDQDQ